MCKGNCRTSIYSHPSVLGENIYIYTHKIYTHKIYLCENPFQFVYVNQGEFFLSHTNVETSSAIAFVMGDDRLFVLVYQPVIITYLCGKRESMHHHRVCAYAALSSMLIYLLSLTYSANIDEYAPYINYKHIGKLSFK